MLEDNAEPNEALQKAADEYKDEKHEIT